MPRPGRKLLCSCYPLSTRQSLSFWIKESFHLAIPFWVVDVIVDSGIMKSYANRGNLHHRAKGIGADLHFHKLADPHTLETSKLPFFVFLLSLHSYRSPKMFSFIFVALNTPKFRFTKHTKNRFKQLCSVEQLHDDSYRLNSDFNVVS